MLDVKIEAMIKTVTASVKEAMLLTKIVIESETANEEEIKRLIEMQREGELRVSIEPKQGRLGLKEI